MQCASDYKIWLSQWVYRKRNCCGGSYCLLLSASHQVEQEIRSSSSVLVTKMNYLEKTSGLKPNCLCKPCTTLEGFHWWALVQELESFEMCWASLSVKLVHSRSVCFCFRVLLPQQESNQLWQWLCEMLHASKGCFPSCFDTSLNPPRYF